MPKRPKSMFNVEDFGAVRMELCDFWFHTSDVVGEQKSGSGRVRVRHFGVSVEVGFLTSGFFGFGYFPLGESGFGVFKFL